MATETQEAGYAVGRHDVKVPITRKHYGTERGKVVRDFFRNFWQLNDPRPTRSYVDSFRYLDEVRQFRDVSLAEGKELVLPPDENAGLVIVRSRWTPASPISWRDTKPPTPSCTVHEILTTPDTAGPFKKLVSVVEIHGDPLIYCEGVNNEKPFSGADSFVREALRAHGPGLSIRDERIQSSILHERAVEAVMFYTTGLFLLPQGQN